MVVDTLVPQPQGEGALHEDGPGWVVAGQGGLLIGALDSHNVGLGGLLGACWVAGQRHLVDGDPGAEVGLHVPQAQLGQVHGVGGRWRGTGKGLTFLKRVSHSFMRTSFSMG